MEGHSDPTGSTATVGPADWAVAAGDAVAAAAAAERESRSAPWRDLWQAARMRWTMSSDASSGSRAAAAAGRGSGFGSGRRPRTGSPTTGTARNRTGVAGGRNSAGSGRAHASLAVRQKRLGGSEENLRPSWSELFGAGGAEGRLKWVRCGSASGRRRGAAVEALADPSCWGRRSPRGRRENRTGADGGE